MIYAKISDRTKIFPQKSVEKWDWENLLFAEFYEIIWPGCLTITSQDDPSTGPAGGYMGRYVIGNIVNILTIEVTIMLFV